jgi:hypothetical protein
MERRGVKRSMAMSKGTAIAISSLCVLGLGYFVYSNLSRLELDDFYPSFEEEHDEEFDRN